MKDWSTIVLAAGKGVRLGGAVPKPLRELGGKPLIAPILERSQALGVKEIIIPISVYTEKVREVFPGPMFTYVLVEPKGTGYCALVALEKAVTPRFMMTHADDSYFLKQETLQSMAALQGHTNAGLIVGYHHSATPHPFAIIETEEDQEAEEIYEKVVAYHHPSTKPPHDSSHKLLAGVYAGETEWVKKALSLVGESVSGEIEFPTIIQMALDEGIKILAMRIPDGEWYGVNTPGELEEAEDYIRKRK